MISFYSPAQLTITLLGYGLLLWIFWNGQLRQSRWWLPVAGAATGVLLGLSFYIQHWTGAYAILLTSGGLLLFFYATWFTRKTHRQRLDWLKLGYMAALGATCILLGLGWRPLLPWAHSVRYAMLWAVILDFVYITYIRRPTQPPTA